MTRWDSWIERKYGKRLIKNRFLFTIFAIVFTDVAVCLLLPLLISNDDTLLAKTGTAASIIGVFIGTYIATWLINQNRTRRIEENYFYKISLLADIQNILHDVSCVLSEIKYEKTSGKMDAAKIAKLQKSGAEAFEYHKSQIEVINSNTFVPADIRAAVKLLVEQGIKSITVPSGYSGAQEIVVRRTLLRHLNRVIDSKYFTKDRDEDVQKMLKEVREYRKQVIESAGPS